jgi:hypothetical protein
MTEWVRCATRKGDLTYHRPWCRHARGGEPVKVDEVRRAVEIGKFTRRRFRGRQVAINVCGTCATHTAKPWPPWPAD